MAILLTGGTGKTSVRLARFLQNANIPFLLASRRGSAAAPAGMPAVKFDWLDEDTWSTPFSCRLAGGTAISTIYLMEPQVAEPWKPMIEFIEYARKEHGVGRFVLVAGSSADPSRLGMGLVWQHFLDTGVDYCVLRPSWFMENLSDEAPHDIIRDQSKIYTACGDGKIPFVSAIDIAAVAFRALTDPQSHNCDHRVLGPELLTYDEVAEKLSAALGRTIEHVKLSDEQRYKGLVDAGVSEYYARSLTNLEVAASTGFETRLNDAVEKVTGRAPRTLDLFAYENVGAWQPETRRGYEDYVSISRESSVVVVDTVDPDDEDIMGPRRSHTKSRSGCRQCKLRRIKCDETPPQCSNCARRQIDCDLATRTPPASASSSATSRPTSNNRSFNHGDTAPATPTASATTTLSPLELAPAPASTLNGTVAPSAFAAANIPDLELLHHYTTFTYKTLPSGAAGAHHELWQVQVVRLGFEHEFLLRGILAVSALHLACLNPSRQEELALRASAHQSIAVAFFHEALNRVDPHNCVAIFAFSCIVVALTFATPRPPQVAGVGIETDTRIQKEIFDWFHMVRGCNSVVQTQWEPLSQSFLAPLLKKGMIHETAAAHDVCGSDKVAELFQLCTGSDRIEGDTPDTTGSSGSRGRDREASTAYTWAIHELVNTYTQVSVLMKRGQDFVPVIFVWPIAIPQYFLVLLSEQRPEALVILAYYAALLQRVDDQWYMHGWARYLVNSIDSTLPDEWASWLKWPKEVTAIL
ncbi:hypothetical protein FQN49_001594 [Arthroderma sp. PD_2]|nr:hypothetical protein FQN49_001594 [Arthroderma sp. PD_2]